MKKFNSKNYIKKMPILWILSLVTAPIFSFSATLILSIIGRDLTTHIIAGSSVPEFLLYIGLGFGLLLANSLLYNIGRQIKLVFEYRVDYRVKNDIFDKILSAKYTDLNKTSSGDIYNYYNVNAQNFIKSFTEDLSNIASPIIISIGIIISLLVANIILAIIAALAIVIVFVSNMYFIKRYTAVEKQRLQTTADYSTKLNNYTDALLSVKMLNIKDKAKLDIEQANNEVLQNELKNTKLAFIQSMTISWVVYGMATLTLPIACLLSVYGGMSVSNVVYATQLCGNIIWNAKSLGNALTSRKTNILSVEKLNNIMNLAEDRTVEGKISIDDNSKNVIEIINLSINYKKDILKNVNVNFEAGKIYGLIGKSGSGKSSLIKAILGLVDYSGEIRLYSKDIKDHSVSDVRNLIAYLPENNVLTDESIIQNIKYGSNSNEDFIKEILKQACLDDINSIDETLGNSLSGGQKQRVCIARALNKDAKIIFLDEPTSAQDAKNEENLILAFKLLAQKGYTIILTSHRLPVIESCDSLLLISDGKISTDVSIDICTNIITSA